MSSIKLKIVNPSLTDEGTDALRTNLGGFYAIAEAEDGQTTLAYSSSLESANTNTKVKYPEHEFIRYSSVLSDNVVTASNQVILPSYKVPVVLAGRPKVIKNDIHWRSILQGLSYGTSSYSPILRPSISEDNVLSLEMSYDLLSLKKIVDSSYGGYEYHTQGYVYNYYHQPYETRLKTVDNTIIPNLYLLNAAYLEQTSSLDMDLVNFVSLEENTDTNTYKIDSLFDSVVRSYPPPMASDENTAKKNRFRDEQHQYKAYLDLYVDTTFSGSTERGATKLSNIIFDRDFLDLTAGVNFESVPYYMDMSWARSERGTIGDLLVDNEIQNLFMKMIKKEFVDNRKMAKRMSSRTQITSVSASASSVDDSSRVGSLTYLTFDLLPQCLEYIRTPDTPLGDFTVLNHDMLEKQILTNQHGIYRHIKKSRMMSFVSDAIDYVDTYSRKTILEAGGRSGSLSAIFDDAQGAKTSEVLGYRIEKIGGTPVGESRSLAVLANYYIFNAGTDGSTGLPTPADDDKFHFYDTQVKYGADYGYNIYQYMAVVGYRARYGNIQISRQIGTIDTDSDGTDDTNCLEFESSPNIASTWDRPDGKQIYTLLSGSGVNQNPYATSAQVLSDEKYLAMFEYTVEPYVRIIEIPLGSKRLAVFDHPPRATEVIPYQKKDASQTIGFYAKYESFVPRPYPATIGPTEKTFKTTYLSSNNLLETEDISSPATKPTSLQVFRITEKPTSYNDFANNLVATKPLRDATFEFPFTNCLYEERIQTNQKYYYMFRFLNQHFMPGHLSPVVEVELVSDGSYKYTLFDIVGSSDITDVISVDAPSKAFKKLLKLVPSPAQVIIDDSSVDYGGDAADQISNLVVGNASEKIWDKTFKVRLTSKKTGEKIDINVTYNLTSE